MSSHYWILRKQNLDLSFILLPGIVGIILSLILKENSIPYVVYAFIALIIIDAGHVYITAWRTIFRKEERQSNNTYWLTPVATVILVFIWLKFQIPGFWSFIVYFTLFHHMRQFYGILRGYQKLMISGSWRSAAVKLPPCLLVMEKNFEASVLRG